MKTYCSKYIIKLSALLVLSFIQLGLNAQSFDGKDFWFAYGAQGFADNQQRYQVHITSDSNTTVTLEIPLQNWDTTFNITANQIKTMDIPYNLAQNETHPGTGFVTGYSQVIRNTGVHMVADDPCILYVGNYQPYSSDAATAVPTSALGYTYDVIAYSALAGNRTSSFILVATEDNTTITIVYNGQTRGGTLSGATETINLDSGQVYQALSNSAIPLIPPPDLNNNRADFTGTRITSDKKIALFGGSPCAVVGDCPFCDHLVEQIRPLTSWGYKHYATNTYKVNASTDIFRVYASENGTQVRVNGNVPITLNAKERLELDITGGQYFESTKPVHVTQYLKGSTCTTPALMLDPLMQDIIPENQMGNRYTFGTSSYIRYNEHYATIIVETGQEGTLLLNGSPLVPIAPFVPIAGSSFSYGYVSLVPNSSYTLESNNQSKIAVYSYGYGAEEAYGFTAGGKIVNLCTVITTDTSICKGNPVDLKGININTSTGLPVNGNQLAWYSTPTGGTPVYTGDSVRTGAITGNTVYYAQVDNLACFNDRYPINITAFEGPQIGTVTRNCDITVNPKTYTIQFNLSGGDPASYSVTGDPGTLTGNSFISDPIVEGNSYSFFIDDMNQCGPVVVAGSFLCNCTSTAGTMNTVADTFCIDEMALAVHNLDTLQDSNDVLNYIIHTSPSNAVGNILGINNIPSFAFDANNMIAGVTYYISAIIGNDDGFGNTVLTDPCLSVAAGTPVTFIENPIAKFIINGFDTICSGDSVDITIDISGSGGPYDIIYNINSGANINLNGVLNGDVIRVAPNTTSLYQINNVIDARFGCSNSTLSPAEQVFVYQTPDAVILPDEDICNGESVEISFMLTGTGPYTINYNDGNNSYTSDGSNFFVTPATTTVYTIESVMDQYCLNEDINSDATVTVLPKPNARFSGHTNICNGADGEIVVNLNVGSADYQIEFSVDGGASQSASSTGNSADITIPVTTGGVYRILSVTDADGCTNSTLASTVTVLELAPQPQFSYSPNPVNTNSPFVNINNQSSSNGNGLSYEWTLNGNAVSSDSDPNITLTNFDNTNVICLNLTEGGTCTSQICKTIETDSTEEVNFSFFLPNAFSPNGDGINELFGPIYEGIDEDKYSLKIYDRWGTKVYESSNPNKWWDGKIHNSNKISLPIKGGSYIWKARFTLLNSRKMIELDGNVIVIK